MTYKLVAAFALSLGLGTAALAQTDMTQPETGAALPPGWEGEVGDAFFADPDTGTLLPEEEVRANWMTLSEEQQAQVRAHCDTVAAAGPDTGAPLDDPAAEADTLAGDDAAPDDEVITGATTPDETHDLAIAQACDIVDTM